MNPKSFCWTLAALSSLPFLLSQACATSKSSSDFRWRSIKAPVAAVRTKEEILHGERRVDPYFWLRERTNPAVVAYLKAENAYAAAVMRPTAPLQETLYREMLSHIKETDLGVPYRKGDYFYYSRTERGKQYAIHCRKKGSLDAREEILLDLNELAKGEKFLALGMFKISDDANLLAYSLDRVGFRQYTLQVKDLRTGRVLPDHAEKVGSVVWAADNRTLFYTVEDPAKRFYRLYKHTLSATRDDLVYEEKDERFDISADRSRSDKFIFLSSDSHTTSEVQFLSADQPGGAWTMIAPRRQDHEYEVDHQGGFFYIRSNDKGRNFRLVRTLTNDFSESHWEEILPHRENVMLEGIECFANHYVLLEREGGLPQIQVTSLRDGVSHRVVFSEAVYNAYPQANPEFNTTAFRYGYESPVTPDSVFDYDMDKRETKLLKRLEVPGGFDPARYHTERLQATASDGTRIPVSVVYRKGMTRDGNNPVLLDGYGSYGFPLPVDFDSTRLSLLDRGVVCVFAHVRGGGDLGKTWHDRGRMMNKRNTFTDFIAVAEFLISEKITRSERLAITGASAGGLLMGAVVNLRPDLFKAVVTRVPFVDVINTMLDESLPLTVGEFEEWGNPKKPDEYRYMMSYSPYDNLTRHDYPSMLVKTSFDDSQVMYWEPAKYVAKMRTLKTDDHPLIFKINMAGGHGGSSGRYDRLRELAFDFAFILTQLGIRN